MIFVWLFFILCGIWMVVTSIIHHLFNRIVDQLELEFEEKKLIHRGIYDAEVESKLNDAHSKIYRKIIFFSKVRRGSMLLLIILSILIIVLDVVIE